MINVIHSFVVKNCAENLVLFENLKFVDLPSQCNWERPPASRI